MLSYRKNRAHLEAEVEESKIVRRNKTEDTCEKWRIQMSSGNTLLAECNGGCFPQSILIMYYYLRTTIAIVFCQAVLFSITAVSPGHFMIIYEISCVWKKAVCSKFIYWKVAARLSLRKEGSNQKKNPNQNTNNHPKKPLPNQQPLPGFLLLLDIKLKSSFFQQTG